MEESFGDEFNSSDQEITSPDGVLKELEEAWLNEKFCPELLPSQEENVNDMMHLIQEMESNLSQVKKTDFRNDVHRMELARVRYIITSYLRTRLEKIEQNTAYILEQESQRGPQNRHLSEGEVKFAKEFLALQESHSKQLVLKHMPHPFQDYLPTQQSLVPNLRSHVFLRAKTDVHGVVIEGDRDNRDEEVDLDENSQHIMQYQPIANFVKQGSVQLI